MALFGSDWKEEEDDYDKNFSVNIDKEEEDYDKSFSTSIEKDEEDEDSSIKHFQD